MTPDPVKNSSGLRVKASFDSTFEAADLESWCEANSKEWSSLQVKLDLRRSFEPSVHEALVIFDAHFGKKLSLHMNCHDPRQPGWDEEVGLYESVLPTTAKIIHCSTAVAGRPLGLGSGKWLVENAAGSGSSPTSLNLMRDFISKFSDSGLISACIDYGHLMKCDYTPGPRQSPVWGFDLR